MYLFDWSDLRGLGHRWAEAETPTTRRKQLFRSPAVRSRHPRYLWLQYKVSIMFWNHSTLKPFISISFIKPPTVWYQAWTKEL